MAKSRPDVYFANLPDDEIAQAILEKVELYFQFLKRSGLHQTWKNTYKAYYNSEIVSAEIYATGNQNEYRNLNVNHFRSVLTNLKSMISQQRIAYDAKATNSDVKSMSQAILANGLLEYYTAEKHLDEYSDLALESAIVVSEGWIFNGWDVQGGEVYGYQADTKAPIYEGDLKYNFYLPTQVVRDVTKQKFTDNQWFIAIDFVNRWDLIANHPELETEIKDITSNPLDYNRYTLYSKYGQEETEDIPVFTLYHMKTPSVPAGKMCSVIDDKTVVFSGPIPYRRLPLHRMTTSDHLAWNFGYSLSYDVAIIQNGLNILDSIVLTNQSTFGVQNVIAARGTNLEVSQLAGGLNLIEWDVIEGASEPRALNLTSTPAEIFNYRATLLQDVNLISGINAVARGDMTALGKNMSGSAMALIQTMAIQYANALQKSYVQTIGDVGTDTIYILRDFAKVPRIAMIAGEQNAQYMKEFVGDDLNQINRVIVDVGNPMAQTKAGRIDLADKYLEHGWATTPEQYTQVMATGRLEPVLQGAQSQSMQISRENKAIVDGGQLMAVITDDHVGHIIGHAEPITGEGRFDPQIVQRATQHIQEHIQLLKTSDPLLLSIMHQPVVPQGPPPGPPQGAPPPGPPKPMLTQGGPMNPQNAVQQKAESVKLPNLPQSPIQ